MNEHILSAMSEDAGKRIDSYLSEQIEGLTRSAAQNLLRRCGRREGENAEKELQAAWRRTDYRYHTRAPRN